MLNQSKVSKRLGRAYLPIDMAYHNQSRNTLSNASSPNRWIFPHFCRNYTQESQAIQHHLFK